MKTIADLLSEIPALGALAPEHRDTIAGCARHCAYRDGETIMGAGEAANAFHVIRQGAVALQTFVPQGGPVIVETLHGGELLGWSWLVPPYRVAFDCLAVGTVQTIEFDGACLRGKCEQDPALGYDLLKIVATVFVRRLEETRMRLLDLYAGVPGAG